MQPGWLKFIILLNLKFFYANWIESGPGVVILFSNRAFAQTQNAIVEPKDKQWGTLYIRMSYKILPSWTSGFFWSSLFVIPHPAHMIHSSGSFTGSTLIIKD